MQRSPGKSDTFSNRQARRITLAAQGFGGARSTAKATWPTVERTLRRLSLLQLDSVSVLVRSHYLPAYARIGHYDMGGLDRRGFGAKRREYFEYWAHEASLLPLHLQPLFRWRMAEAAAGRNIYSGLAEFARDQNNYVEAVLREIAERGPLSARELSDPGKRNGPWWGWHKGKTALEYLFWAGRVTTAERRGFERVYDLTERVLPEEILDLPTPAPADAQRALISLAAQALGVATQADLRDYFRLPLDAAARAVSDLVDAGELLPVTVESWRQTAYLHREARIPGRIVATALLSPFDPLVWERARTERLFEFHYRLEFYTPEPKRKFGYYVMPFLWGDRLVGRVDVKADRGSGTLLVLGAYAEPHAHPTKAVAALAEELRHLALWLGLSHIRVGERGEFARPLRGLLS